jgi:hypothetical protein
MKTYNLGFLVSVTYIPLVHDWMHSYAPPQKKTFWKKEVKGGWYWDTTWFTGRLNETELKKKYTTIDGELYYKSSVILNFVDKSMEQVYFDSNEAAIHEYKMYQSMIPNPIKFEENGK